MGSNVSSSRAFVSFVLFVLFVVRGGLHSPVPARCETTEALFQKAKSGYQTARALSRKEERNEALRHCIPPLQQVMREDAEEKLADRCLYLLGQVYHHLYDATRSPEYFQGALESYGALADRFHDSPLADDAQYLTGILVMREDPARAYVELRRVGLFFPKGDMLRQAAEKLAELKENMPLTEISPQKDLPSRETPAPFGLAGQLSLDVRRIVIDPGHGGRDKGATGAGGLFEKDVTLWVAKELQGMLVARLGCEVALTRTRDRFVSLEERTAMANLRKADLFISIHTNAHPDCSLYGTETYFLNISKDRESDRVAALENATSGRKMRDLEAILNDLLLNTKMKESMQLAHEVQRNLMGTLRRQGYEELRDLGTKQAPFCVLLGAQMPSVLIETAFITNEREEIRLSDKSFRQHLATGIAAGIESYARQIQGLANAGGAR